MSKSFDQPGRGFSRRILFVTAAMGGVLFGSDPLWSQVGGHDTVPTSGPAAREHHGRATEDPVLIQVERIRQDLAAFAKRYRKAKGAEREALARTAPGALEEIKARVQALHDSAGSSR